MSFPRVARVLAALVVLVLLPLPGAGAETAEQRKRRTDAALAARHDDLAESTARVHSAYVAMRSLAAELSASQVRLAQTRNQLRAAEESYLDAQARLRGAEIALGTAERATSAAVEQLRVARGAIAQVVRAEYIRGPAGYAAALLASSSPQDLVDRVAFLESAVAHQGEAARAIADARAAVVSQQSVLAARRDEVAAQNAAAESALERVTALTKAAESARIDVGERFAAHESAVRAAERERAADLAAYRALQAESRRLAALIRGKGKGGSGKITGSLVWPTQGPITSRYGYRVHPIYGYKRFHAGIDIGAPSGQIIKSARAGKVIHAGPLGTFGNLVVVDHGGGFSTAYAHQSKVLVKVGQQVKAGQTVGRVGSTGASTGPHLHYETRVNGEPVDPMKYY